MTKLTPDLVDYVTRVIRKLTSNFEEDLVQETLLKAHQYADAFKGDCSYKTWLYYIAKSTVIRRAKYWKWKKRNAPTCTFTDTMGQAHYPDPSAGLRLQEIASKIKTFGPKREQIFWQYFAEGMTEGELAKRHDMKTTTIRTHIYRMRKALNGVC